MALVCSFVNIAAESGLVGGCTLFKHIFLSQVGNHPQVSLKILNDTLTSKCGSMIINH